MCVKSGSHQQPVHVLQHAMATRRNGTLTSFTLLRLISSSVPSDGAQQTIGTLAVLSKQGQIAARCAATTDHRRAGRVLRMYCSANDRTMVKGDRTADVNGAVGVAGCSTGSQS